MGSSLFEKYPISYATNCDETLTPFSLCLNAQITEHLFKCVLTSLQIHGEHSELASLIMNLGFLVYEKASPLIQDTLNKNFLQIPNVNKKQLEEFFEKMMQMMSGKENKPTTTTATTNGANIEKLKKDCNQLFKKIVQPIVGKSVGQLYKNEIHIKNLQPLNIMTKRKAAAEATSYAQVNFPGGEVFNICSLFDPNL